MPESNIVRLRNPARAAPARAPSPLPFTSQGLLGVARLPLHGGGALERAVVAWRLVGPAGAPVVAALGGISARPRGLRSRESRPGLVARTRRSRAPARHRPLRGARHRLARRRGRELGADAGAGGFPGHRCARPGGGAARGLRLARHRAPARRGRRFLRRHGRPVARRDRAEARRDRARHQRRASQPRARDRLAQRPARDRPAFPRPGRRPGRARAGAGARDDHLPHARGARAPLSRAGHADAAPGGLRRRAIPAGPRRRLRRSDPAGMLPVPVRIDRPATASIRRASACPCTWWRSPRTSS